jgi:hypothetical protein
MLAKNMTPRIINQRGAGGGMLCSPGASSGVSSINLYEQEPSRLDGSLQIFEYEQTEMGF